MVLKEKLKVLFLCTGNSCRSQMAEGWARALKSDVLEAYSAGIETHGLNPDAVKVMAEVGVDISTHCSKRVDGLMHIPFDCVVTVCGHAHETCPRFPGKARIIHAGFDDPPKLALGAATEEERLAPYRRVRDEIRQFVSSFPGSLKANEQAGQDFGNRASKFAKELNMGCCNNKSSDISTQEAIREAYGKIALQGGGCCGGLSSISSEASQALGYQSDELAVLPNGADMGLSCGNPNALAALKSGEVVLDLGSGGGFDVFLAARKVGPSGLVIGVDMTPEMIAKARKNLLTFQAQTGLSKVEFRLGEIEHLPAADNSVDVVLSNCVLNLSVDKAQVWREVFRVLKPGGRVAISDIALLKPLPDTLRASIEALIGCIAGAVLIEETKQFIRNAGLIDAVYIPRDEYIEAMKKLQNPLAQKVRSLLSEGQDIGSYITSLEIQAVKPHRK